MRKLTRTILFFGLLLMNLSLNAQMLERADKHFESFAYQEAIDLYEMLWEKDSLNENVTRQLAASYRLINNSQKAELWYAKVLTMPNVENDDYAIKLLHDSQSKIYDGFQLLYGDKKPFVHAIDCMIQNSLDVIIDMDFINKSYGENN